MSHVDYVRKFTSFYITQCLADFIMIQTQPQMNDSSMRYYTVSLFNQSYAKKQKQCVNNYHTPCLFMHSSQSRDRISVGCKSGV